MVGTPEGKAREKGAGRTFQEITADSSPVRDGTHGLCASEEFRDLQETDRNHLVERQKHGRSESDSAHGTAQVSHREARRQDGV